MKHLTEHTSTLVGEDNIHHLKSQCIRLFEPFKGSTLGKMKSHFQLCEHCVAEFEYSSGEEVE